MSRLERDGKITIIFKKGKPEIIIEGDINGRMIKSLPRHLMAAYRRLRLKAQKTETQEEEKKKEVNYGRSFKFPTQMRKALRT